MEAFWRLSEAEQEIHRRRFDEKQSECPHCRNQREDCSDPERVWYPQLTICYATRERLAAQARWERLHAKLAYHDGTFNGWAKDRSEGTPYHFADGATVWVARTDFGLGGDFLAQKGDGD